MGEKVEHEGDSKGEGVLDSGGESDVYWLMVELF